MAENSLFNCKRSLTRYHKNCKLHQKTCKKCDFSTFSQLILLKHNLICQKLKNFCPYCLFKAANNFGLQVHIRKKHTTLDKSKFHKYNQDILYYCIHCEYKTKWKIRLERHIFVKHPQKENVPNVPKHECNKCKSKSVRRHIIVRYSTTDEIKWFQCKHCCYKYKIISDLKQHIVQHHMVPREIEWFQCEHCAYKCKVKSYLTQHRKIHFKSDENVRKNKCNVCKYETVHTSNLKRHITRVHAVSK